MKTNPAPSMGAAFGPHGFVLRTDDRPVPQGYKCDKNPAAACQEKLGATLVAASQKAIEAVTGKLAVE